MAYTPTAWVNGSTPFLSATNLNKIEQGLVDAHGILAGTDQHVRWVDSSGSDSNTGLSPLQPKATLAAAQASLPIYPAVPAGERGGGTIIMAAGDYDVGAGLTVQKYDPINFVSLSGSRTWRLATDSTKGLGNARIYSSAGSPPTQLIRLSQVSGGANGYGGTFKGILFDLSTNAAIQYGIYAENCQFVLVEDCGFIGMAGNNQTTDQWGIRATELAGSGDDCSWWRVYNNMAYHMGLVKTGAAGQQECNQWVIQDNFINPGSHVRAGIDMTGGYRCRTLNNNIEYTTAIAANGTPYGLYLEDMVSGIFDGDAGDVPGKVAFIKSVGCNGCTFRPTGFVSPDAGIPLVDDDTGQNIIMSANLGGGAIGYLGATGGNQNKRVTRSGTSGGVLITGDGIGVHDLAKAPQVLRHAFGWPQELVNVVPSCTLTYEYWNGSSWASWTPTNAETVRWKNPDNVTVDATHQRFRVTIDGLGAPDSPLLFVKFLPGSTTNGTYTGTATYTVEMLNSGGSVVSSGEPGSFTHPLEDGSFEGFSWPLPFSGTIAKARVECSVLVGAAASWKLNYLGLYSYAWSNGAMANTPGQVLPGKGTPEAAVTAGIGTLYLDVTNGVAYMKKTGTGNTGWKLVTQAA